MTVSERVKRAVTFIDMRQAIAKEWYDQGNVLSGETLLDFQRYMRKREKEIKKGVR